MAKNTSPVVRIAPSPTGNLHVGTARSALFNFLFARQNSGRFIVRIEDTDRQRSKKEFEQNILDGLDWLGLSYDELYKQSERLDIYKGELQKLLDKDLIYFSKEEPKESGERTEVIRFRNTNKKIEFQDEIRGLISFDTTELGDFVIAKSLDEPLYHFAVVVDDFLSGVTHVIRGEDHISNTPRQILIGEAIGAPRPVYAHLPLILGKDRSKLSKRHGATSITEFRDRGYLSSAMVNFLALLGFNPGTEKEIYTLDELIEVFDLKKIQKGGAVFDEEKLNWMNLEHIKLLSSAEKKKLATLKINVGEQINITDEDAINILERPEDFDFLKKEPVYDSSKLHWAKGDPSKTKEYLQNIYKLLSDLSDWNSESIKNIIWPYAEKEGRGNVLWPLRFCLTGKEKSPDPFLASSLLGKEKTLERIKNAILL